MKLISKTWCLLSTINAG